MRAGLARCNDGRYVSSGEGMKVREYTIDELHAKLFRSGDRFYLIDVLPHDST